MKENYSHETLFFNWIQGRKERPPNWLGTRAQTKKGMEVQG